MIKSTLVLVGTLLTSHLLLAQLNVDLEASFSFNNTMVDETGNVNSGTNNGTTFTNDRHGTSNGALLFSGDDYYSFNDNSVKVQFPLSISTWVKIDDIAISQPIFFSDNFFGNYHGYWLNTQLGTGRLAINFGGGLGSDGAGNRITYVSDDGLQQGIWYHVVGVINSSTDMKLYVDCSEVPGSYSGSGPQSIAYSSTESRIGSFIGFSSSPTPIYMDGTLDDLMIWGRELTQTDIDQLCEMTLNSDESLIEETLEATPNPTSNVLQIKTSEVDDYVVTVYDLEGQIVQSSRYSELSLLEIDMTQLEPQVYIVVLDNGKTRLTERIVKL